MEPLVFPEAMLLLASKIHNLCPDLIFWTSSLFSFYILHQSGSQTWQKKPVSKELQVLGPSREWLTRGTAASGNKNDKDAPS